jgi:SAM-dependent methyltransferase
MIISKELLGMLKIVGSQKRILDVGCGTGEFVRYISKMFIESCVYGLDINRKALAYGIANGNFDHAYPVHGDSRKLICKNSQFALVYLKPEDFGSGFVDWAKLEERELITLQDFDLVTAFNPYDRLSASEINALIAGETLQRKLVTVDIVSAPAKNGGRIIYQREIAHKLGGLYGSATPRILTDDYVNENFQILLEEGKLGNLELVTKAIVADENSTSLLVLFSKKGCLACATQS